MISIDRVRLQLPVGFEHRATTIARLLGELLAKQSVAAEVSLESVAISPQRVNANTPDIEIAQLIATQIISAYGGDR